MSDKKEIGKKKKGDGENSPMDWVEVGMIFEDIQSYCHEHDLCQRDFCRNAGLRETWLCEYVTHGFSKMRRKTLDKVLYGLSLSSPVRKKTVWSLGEGARRGRAFITAEQVIALRKDLLDGGLSLKDFATEAGMGDNAMWGMTHRARKGEGTWITNGDMDSINTRMARRQ